MKYKLKKFFYIAELGYNTQKYYILSSNNKPSFKGLDYTIDETIDFLKSIGSKKISKISAIKKIDILNSKIAEYENQVHEMWLDYIKNLQEEGYNTAGNFFGGSQEYFRIVKEV